MDQGKSAIRGEAQGGKLTSAANIIFHIPAARLLLGAEEDAHPLAQGRAAALDLIQGEQGGQNGALVVGGAAAVEAAVRDHTAEGGLRPAVAGGNHVQMAQHGHHFFPFAVLGPAHHVVHISGAQAHVPRQTQHIAQRLHGAGLRGAVDGQELLQCWDQIVHDTASNVSFRNTV